MTDTPDEVVTAEVVEHHPEPAAEQTGNDLVRAAAEAALLPGVPGRDEFLTLAMTARILSMSGAAPKLVRGNPYVAFHIALVGRDLGISPSAAIELIDVMDTGGGVRLSLSPQLLNGQIRRLGLGSIVPVIQEVDRCVAVALAPQGHIDYRCRARWPQHVDGCACRGVMGDTEFTWEEARTAGLVGRDCQPDQHSDACGKKDSAKQFKCQQGYKTYPKRMMWWRAGGYCADDWFPEAGLGLYTAEELGAVVDAEGRPIDPTSVDLPDGYQPEPDAPDETITEDQRAELAARIRALPEGAQKALKSRWLGDGDEPYLRPLGKPGEPKLPARQLGKAQALVRYMEDRAEKGEWGEWSPTEVAPAEGATPGDGMVGEDPDAGANPQPAREVEAAVAGNAPDPATAAAPSMAELGERIGALADHQREWLQAAVVKEGIREDRIGRDLVMRHRLSVLVDGAELQAPDDERDLVADAEAIAAKAKGKKTQPETLL